MITKRPRRRERPTPTRGPFLLVALSFALAFALFALSHLAYAGGLSPEEKKTLQQGGIVKRTFDLDLPQGDCVGGLAYVLLPAPPKEIMAILLDPASYAHIFPLTQEAKLVAREGDDFFITFKQGGRTISGEYTVRARRESASLVRFWLDPTRPHDIDDVWGFFRVDPAEGNKTLLSYGALLHLDMGLIKLLFQEKIRSYALETPALLRTYVEEKRAAKPER